MTDQTKTRIKNGAAAETTIYWSPYSMQQKIESADRNQIALAE